MYQMIIYLGCSSPNSSSGPSPNRNATYPKARRATVWPSVWSCFEWGLHSTEPLPARRWSLTPPFHPYSANKCEAVYFLLHFPWGYPHRTLSGTLPYEARTFLTSKRSRDRLSRSTVNYKYTFILNQDFIPNHDLPALRHFHLLPVFPAHESSLRAHRFPYQSFVMLHHTHHSS